MLFPRSPTQLPIHSQSIRRRNSQFVRGFATLCMIGVSALVTSSRVEAQTFNSSFGGQGFACFNLTQPTYCNGSNNGRPDAILLGPGDFWNQTISGSGLASVSSLKLNLSLVDLLSGQSTMQFAVLLNGTVVGSTTVFGANGFNDILAPFTFNFQAISAATYDVKVRVSAVNITSNNDAIAMYTDGTSTIQLVGAQTTVPEPGTYLLMMTGLAGVAVLSRKRQR